LCATAQARPHSNAATCLADNVQLIAKGVASHKFLPQFYGHVVWTGSGKSFTIFNFPMLAIASMAPGDFPRRGLCFSALVS
jgi:hypothetical protein